MIIVQQIGGLGNQMFQYAAARSLSLRLKTDMALDISAYASATMHQGFELKRIFNIHARIAERSEIVSMLGLQAYPLVRKILRRPQFAALRSKSWLVEPHFNFWEGLSHIVGSCYLSGYWQSEKYFSDIAKRICEDFSFIQPMQAKNIEIAAKLSSENAVSLHVRRGDYASNRKIQSVHGLCDLEYYRSSLEYMAQNVVDPVIYIFSDDIPWVRNNLDIRFQHQYVDHNRGNESWNDMRLMSMCRNNIIANSSFSWWGAWLNPAPKKIVIAPRNWFANGRATPDLCPEQWVRL